MFAELHHVSNRYSFAVLLSDCVLVKYLSLYFFFFFLRQKGLTAEYVPINPHQKRGRSAHADFLVVALQTAKAQVLPCAATWVAAQSVPRR